MNEGLIVDVDRGPGTGDILAGSAILCWSDDDATPVRLADGMVDIWFEGNLHGAVNLNDYHEKIVCAAGRMVTRYPTVARRTVEAARIRVLASFDLRRMFVVRIHDEPGWTRMLAPGESLRPAPPEPEFDVIDRAAIVRQMVAVGYRHLPLLSPQPAMPQAYQLRDGRVVLSKGSDDMQMFWPDDLRIEQLRYILSPDTYLRIEPDAP